MSLWADSNVGSGGYFTWSWGPSITIMGQTTSTFYFGSPMYVTGLWMYNVWAVAHRIQHHRLARPLMILSEPIARN